MQNNPQNHEEIASSININKNFNQSNILIHQIEDPNIFRKKYPYETFIEKKMPECYSKLRKDYSNLLKLGHNIEPLAFFSYKNLQLDLKSMKSYIATVSEYYQEYRDFDIDALKSHFIEMESMEKSLRNTFWNWSR